MNIIDCVTYFDEDLILDIRLNILNKYVSKFIISEGKFDHRGNERDLKFKLENFRKFKDKIIYIVVDNFPNLNDPWKMLEYQRNSSQKYLKQFDKNDFVLVSDVDEIPNPISINNFLKSKKDIGVFNQLFFYYKLNLINSTSPNWLGSKICRLKKLKSPNWLREYKAKQYPWWRVDKPENLNIIENGGWHFSFLYDVDGIIKKIKSFQHTEFDKEDIKNPKFIKNMINTGQDIFKRGFKFNKIDIDDRFPEYIKNNQGKFSNWIQV